MYYLTSSLLFNTSIFLMTTNINRIIGILFFIFFLIVSSIFYLSYESYNEQISKEKWVFHTSEVILTSEKVLSFLKDIETGHRGYIITSDSSFMAPYLLGQDSLAFEMKRLKTLTNDNIRQQLSIDTLNQLFNDKIDIIKNAISVVNKEKASAERERKILPIIIAGKVKMEQVRSVSANIIAEEKRLLTIRSNELNISKAETRNHAYGLGIVFVIYAVSSLFYLRRLIRKQDYYKNQLIDANRELTTLNLELRATNEELTAASEELSAANEEITSANEEITAANEELTSINEELSSANEVIRKQSEDLLRLSEEKLNQLLNTIDDVVWSVDLNTFELVFVSKSSEIIFGYSQEEMKDHKVRGNITHPDDKAIISETYKEIIVKKHIQSEYRCIHKNGDIRWVSVKMSLATDANGLPAMINGVTSDITEKKLTLERVIESEKNYKYLFENNPLPMWIADVNTLRFLDVNNAAVIKYGYSREEFLSFTLKDIRPKEDASKIEAYLKSDLELLNNAGAWKHQKKNGEIIDVEVFTHILKYNNTDARFALVNDVTENKIAQKKQMKTYHELLGIQYALDSSALVSITDKEGKIIKVNKNFCEVTGYSEDELIGKTHKIINSRFHPKEFFTEMWETISLGKVWSGEIKNRSKNRVFFWVSTVITPILDTNNNIISYMSIRFLITERKIAEIERELIADELIRRNEDLEHFAYITSHNLRAPLANILGLTKIFNKTFPSDPVNVKTMEKLEIAGVNLDTIINDMNYILSVRKDINESKSILYLEEMVERINESIENLIVLNEAKITYDFAQEPTVFAIKSYLHNIIINLITNAIKYKAFDRKPEIHLRSYTDGHYTCLKVSDNGLGVDLTTQKDKIFKLYKRFHFHTEGKGMGLYLVKTQIEAMGGKITIESIVNKGSAFTVYFKQES
jgi:PAS domain S-box-containing protein